MIKLAHEDMQDNVLLELIIARELHLISKKITKTNSKNVLAPCSYIFPLFRQRHLEMRCGILFAKDRICLDQRQGKEGHESKWTFPMKVILKSSETRL